MSFRFSFAQFEATVAAHARTLGAEAESEVGRAFASLVEHFRGLPARLAEAEALLKENGYSVSEPAQATDAAPAA